MEKQEFLLLVGTKISSLRKKAGFTQEEFSYKVGLDRSYYGGIEWGERNVSSINLMRIAFSLGVEVGDLFPTLKEIEKYLDCDHSIQ
jgi:transcriptional regulator with XRE-family HTH domain